MKEVKTHHLSCACDHSGSERVAVTDGKCVMGTTGMESRSGKPSGCTWEPVVITQIEEKDAGDAYF